MRLLQLVGVVAMGLAPCFWASASTAQQFDPRKMNRMPAVLELPDPAMTSEQVKTTCLRLFDNKNYSMKAATGTGASADATWLLNRMEGYFFTAGEILTGTISHRPLCTVNFSWKWNSPYVFGGRKDIRASFDGKILYRHFDPPQEKTGYLMIVEGDSLKFTHFFYWGYGDPAKPNATVHFTWGLFSRD